MFEESGVLVCFRCDLVWFLDVSKPSIAELKAGIRWKAKTENKVCKVHAQRPKKFTLPERKCHPQVKNPIMQYTL